MADPTNLRPSWRVSLFFLLPALAVALLVRLYFFGGVSLADDVNYWTQAIATGLGGDWPPLKQHWHTRIGLVLPCALLLKVFGLKIWVPYIFTLLGGLLEIVLTYHVARRLTNETTARLAAWLCVFFPLNILYSSYLYVDLWAGMLGAASLYFWHRGMEADRIRYYALASTFFGLAWLLRETIIMCVPIFVVLWIYSRRWHSPKFLWILPPGILIFLSESLLYHLTAGNWHYRLDAIMASRGQLLEDFGSARRFWLQPFVELMTSHELGIFMGAALIIALVKPSKIPRPVTLWLLVGFTWLCWGTTVPSAWVPLQGDPRYLTVLTIPCLIVLAKFITDLPSRYWRVALAAGLMLSGLICASADMGKIKLSAHRRLVASSYNRPDTAVEPFVYFGARATQGFKPDEIHFACVTDLGRASALAQIERLPGTSILTTTNAHYLVVSAQIQPEKWEKKIKEGWRTVEVIRGDRQPARDFAVKLLTLVGQPTRREPVVRSPVLAILENPAWPHTNSPAN